MLNLNLVSFCWSLLKQILIYICPSTLPVLGPRYVIFLLILLEHFLSASEFKDVVSQPFPSIVTTAHPPSQAFSALLFIIHLVSPVKSISQCPTPDMVEASLVIILYQLLNKFKSLYSQLSSFIDKRPLSSPDASIKLRQDNQRFLPLSFCSDSRTIDTLECNGLSSFLPYLEI